VFKTWRDEDDPEYGIREKCIYHDSLSIQWNLVFKDYEGNMNILIACFKEFLEKNFADI